VLVPAPGTGALLAPVEQRLRSEPRLRVVPLNSLLPMLRQADAAQGLSRRASEDVERGRKALLTLDLATARKRLQQALVLLRGGFIRYYDARRVAQVEVLLGVVTLHEARPDRARQHFVAARQLDPSFELDAHYSPQVRQAFKQAGQSPPPAPLPPPADLRRIAAVAEAKMVVVVSLQRAGGQDHLQGSLYVEPRGAYVEVESRPVDLGRKDAARVEAAALGDQLAKLLQARLPAGPGPKLVGPGGPGKPPPPPRPWYKRWYTWVAVAGAVAAVSAAVAVPLALKKEYVEGQFTWWGP
jgi:hypothetical protein